MSAGSQPLPPIHARQALSPGLPRQAGGSDKPMRAPKPWAGTRVRMNEVKDRAGFLREGLFAKYVVALVGLVVFVLAINGAMEVWISYRGIKSSLNDGMSEKAEATAKRIQQSLSDLDRQISWVTRASATKITEAATLEQHREDYA